MDHKDFFYTVGSLSKGLYKEKGSRFISFAMPVRDSDEAKSQIDKYRKIYHDARHHCYAYITGPEGEHSRSNDDGEPSGTAGGPIMSQIKLRDLTNTLVIVVRYFGGKLLGTAGLVNAYRSAAADALDKATVIKCILYNYYSISYPYNKTGQVMKILNEAHAKIVEQNFAGDCSLIAGIRQSLEVQTVNRLAEFPEIRVKSLENHEPKSFK